MTPNPWLLLVLLCAVVYRVTRFATRDEFPLVKIPREKVVLFLYPEYADEDSRAAYYLKRQGQPVRPHLGLFGKSVAYLMVCDWCMSVWIAALAVTGIWFGSSPNWFVYGWLQAVMYGITAAAFTGLVAQREED